MKQIYHCPNCGEKVDQYVEICDNCGIDLGWAQQHLCANSDVTEDIYEDYDELSQEKSDYERPQWESWTEDEPQQYSGQLIKYKNSEIKRHRKKTLSKHAKLKNKTLFATFLFMIVLLLVFSGFVFATKDKQTADFTDNSAITTATQPIVAIAESTPKTTITQNNVQSPSSVSQPEAPPSLISLVVNPATISEGQTTNLTWSITGATSVSLDQGIGFISASGTLALTPTSNTTYTLVAANSGGFKAWMVSVTVTPMISPVINTFCLDPSEIRSGQSSVLKWNVTGATLIKIDQGIGTVQASGTCPVSPASTATYTISANNRAGSTSATANLTLIPSDPLSIISFTSNQYNISPGQSVNLQWNVKGATQVSIDHGVGIEPSLGNVIVFPTENTTYTLSATNNTLVFSTPITIRVAPAGSPVINYFFANPSMLKVGSNSVLQWDVSGASSVTIDQGIGNVSPFGALAVSPLCNTTYTISAKNNNGTVVSTAAITVVTPDSATSFTAEPNTITPGQTSKLQWTILGVNSVSIDQGIGTVTSLGEQLVAPTRTTTYVLTSGLVTLSATVQVVPKGSPSIASFATSNNTINTGQLANIQWNVIGANSVSVNPGTSLISLSASGSQSVSPNETTTYVLAAKNDSGSVTSQVTITVIPTLPAINSFASNPNNIISGQNSSLLWNVTGASEVSISPDIGHVALSGTLVISPAATTNYTLTATNGAGSITGCTTVVVTPKLPVISGFTANPNNIVSGQCTTLQWSTNGAASVSINPGIGMVSPFGAQIVSPTASTTYIITAMNSAGSVSSLVTVTTIPALPVITSFTATPNTLIAGQSSTLQWTVTDATSISISPDIGAVQSSGSKVVSPPATTTYTLTATNNAGSITVSISVTIE